MKKNTKENTKKTAKKVPKPSNNKIFKSNTWSSSDSISINELINEESKKNNLEIETIKNNDNELDISKSDKAKLPLDWVTNKSKNI